MYFTKLFFFSSLLTTFCAVEAAVKGMTLDQYEIVKQIGSGAQSTVSLVKTKTLPHQFFAMKTISKQYVRSHNLFSAIFLERNILAHSGSSLFPTLYYAFQSKDSLHLVLEMVQGGDMMELLINKDIFPIDVARFYLAEIALALENLHGRQIIHRDLKPDNILLDLKGHIKLTDFAMSTRGTEQQDRYETIYADMLKLESLYNDRRNSENEPVVIRVPSTRRSQRPRLKDLNTMHRRSQTSVPRLQTSRKDNPEKATIKHKRTFSSLVGTLDYVAPEMFAGTGYTEKCDIWSLGVIGYEMLFGHTPFTAHEEQDEHALQVKTVNNILNFEKTLVFPSTPVVADQVKSFISQLLCKEDDRLDIHQVISHPFFEGVPWKTLRTMRSPFNPQVENAEDLRYFPVDQVQAHVIKQQEKQESPKIEFKTLLFGEAMQSNREIVDDDLFFQNYEYNSFKL